MSARVMIVDDDAGYARALGRLLERDGYDVAICGTAAEARERAEENPAEVWVLDYQLPDADGLALLEELRPRVPGAIFVLNTAYPDLDVAVQAMRRGAFDYVAKAGELRECLIRIGRAAEVAQLRRRVAEAGRDGGGDPGLLGQSQPMKKLRSRLDALAGADETTVFIVGETGTGKGVVARTIHARSGRAFEPLVAVDCTTIPANLMESELFGHEKGAFSGAVSAKQGRVESAGRGTLFLDEIGELELPMQAKLLRLLEEREYSRVGSVRTRNLEARVITATNRDLERAVAEGRFRADLRYRLEVFVVELPPLRDRGEDIPLLAAHFAEERTRTLGRPAPHLTSELLEAMRRYPFPGNVRELRNMVEQAVLLAPGELLRLDDFPVLARAPTERRSPASSRPPPAEPSGPRPEVVPERCPSSVPSAPPPPDWRRDTEPSGPAAGPADLESIRAAHAEAEAAQLVSALRATGGNVSKAARNLGLSRHQVLRRLEKYGLR